MTMESDFRALLTGDPTILGLVSTRIYPSTFAQATVDPSMTYRKVGGSQGLTLQGADNLSSSTIRLAIRSAVGALETQSIRDAIVKRLHGFAGTQGHTDFRLIGLTGDEGISFDDAGPSKYYLTTLTFDVWSKAI